MNNNDNPPISHAADGNSSNDKLTPDGKITNDKLTPEEKILQMQPTLEALTARRREVANEMCRRDVELSVIEKALNVKLQEPDAKEEDIQALVNEISIKTEEFDETMAESTRVGAKVERIKLDMYKLVVEAEKLDKEKAGEA